MAAEPQPAWEPVHAGLGAGLLRALAGMGASPCRAGCRPARSPSRHGSQSMPGWVPVLSGAWPARKPVHAGPHAELASCFYASCIRPAYQPAYAGSYAGLLGALAGMAAISCRLACRPFKSAPPLTCPTGTFSRGVFKALHLPLDKVASKN